MDTDDLSQEAYNAVILEAERFHHDLTLQFGLLSYECSDENEFLEKSAQLILELRQFRDEDLPDVFFDDVPDIAALNKVLTQILRNIEETKAIPFEKREFDF
jgi:hypothetical protein